MKIVGRCVHGLLGNTYSLGMDALAAKLNHATPAGVHFTVVGGNNPNLILDQIEADLLAAAGRGDVPLMIGHSLGGDAVWNWCDLAKTKKIKQPLAISYDPVDWTDNDPKPPVGTWVAPDNVGIGINHRTPYYPGGGYLVAADLKKTLVQEHTYPLAHASWGLASAIDTDPGIHAADVAAVLALCSQLGIATPGRAT